MQSSPPHGLTVSFSCGQQVEAVTAIFNAAICTLSEADQGLDSVVRMLPLLQRGVAVHHSGLLPVLKEVVELLFQATPAGGEAPSWQCRGSLSWPIGANSPGSWLRCALALGESRWAAPFPLGGLHCRPEARPTSPMSAAPTLRRISCASSSQRKHSRWASTCPRAPSSSRARASGTARHSACRQAAGSKAATAVTAVAAHRSRGPPACTGPPSGPRRQAFATWVLQKGSGDCPASPMSPRLTIQDRRRVRSDEWPRGAARHRRARHGGASRLQAPSWARYTCHSIRPLVAGAVGSGWRPALRRSGRAALSPMGGRGTGTPAAGAVDSGACGHPGGAAALGKALGRRVPAHDAGGVAAAMLLLPAAVRAS